MSFLATAFVDFMNVAGAAGGVWAIWKLVTDPWGERGRAS